MIFLIILIVGICVVVWYFRDQFDEVCKRNRKGKSRDAAFYIQVADWATCLEGRIVL